MPRRSQIYRAPSWSWASIDGAIDFEVVVSDRQGMFGEPKIIYAKTTPLGIDPFGQVQAGYLKIRGRLRAVSGLMLGEYETARAFYDEKTLKGLGRAYVDEKDEWSEAEAAGEPLWIFIIKGVAGLLLRPIKGTAMEFRRIGLVYLRAADVGNAINDWNLETVSVI
ncbi:MAG: hypothetical protein MMC33_008027 [Icmadophila ericetorum]|nr:hypothetical protein [Icmadophila ericetorum]